MIMFTIVVVVVAGMGNTVGMGNTSNSVATVITMLLLFYNRANCSHASLYYECTCFSLCS